MTTPVLERVRTIPLVIETDGCIPMAVDDDSGFPFDRDDFDRETRDDSFRSQLDDLAKRHPEFAEHFGSFPFRSGSVGNRSRPPRPSDDEFRRFASRPFGSSSRFERFGFPFSSDPFDDNFEQHVQPETQQQPQQQQQHQEEQQPQQQQQEPSHNQPQQQEQTEEHQPHHQRGRNIQQSNTVDLGQTQKNDESSVHENRNQRSMSAPPPDNRSGGQQRFVSSINIPINRDSGMGDNNTMGAQQSQQPEQQKPTERIIPIHVEGRDEPVFSKCKGPSSYTQQPPQPERIFGHRPSQFSKFMNREPPQRPQFGGTPEYYQNFGHQQQQQQPDLRQQQQQYQQQQQQKFQQQKEIPVQREQQQQVPPQQQQEPPKQQPPSNNPIDIIQAIQKDVSELMSQVEKFSGVHRDKQYLYLDEMLTRNLIKLDNVDTQGQENIRSARKEAIKCIEKCLSILDAKAAANAPKDISNSADEKPASVETGGDTMEVETPKTAEVVQEEKMEVEVKEDAPPKDETSEATIKTDVEKMEVVEQDNNTKTCDRKEEEQGAAPGDHDCKTEEKKLDETQQQVQVQQTETAAADETQKAEEANIVEPNQEDNPANEGGDKKEKKKIKKKVAAKK